MAQWLQKLDLAALDYARFDQWFRRALVGTTVVFGLLQHFFSDVSWLNAVFIVLMAGNVGYFTNFMAIKMLFQPKKGRVLGWRGLVPQNKANIASSLADSVQTQLLAPEILLTYINERDLLGKGIDYLSEWVDDSLQDEQIQAMITNRSIAFLKLRGPDLLTGAFEFSETRLKDLARDPETIEQVWQGLRTRLLAYLEDEDNRRIAADHLRRFLLEEVPELSRALNDALEEYLRRKRGMGSIGLSVKRIASFDRDAIQELLERFVNDPDAGQQMLGMVDVLIERLRVYLESRETRELVQSRVEDWVARASDSARETLLPQLIERLEAWLDDERNWSRIEQYCLDGLKWARKRLIVYARSPEGQAFLRKQLERLVLKLNVTQLVEEQVMNLDTDELEKMILDNTGGNLVAIQVLGGSLGMIAGLIQVHIGFAVPVFILIALVWLDAYRNRLRHPT
jgi:uncharacterized membrane protein YheB (UPF0754 family)